MNESTVATVLLMAVLGTIYYAAFRVSGTGASASASAAGLDLWTHEQWKAAAGNEAGEDGPASASDGGPSSDDDPASEGSGDESAEEDSTGGGESTDDESSDGDLPPATRLGPRWDPGTTVALLAGAVGVLAQNTTVFLAGVVGFVFAAYRYGTRPPEPAVSVERAVADRSPPPSEDVAVAVTVRNEGEESIPDLRVVDGVPERLGVVSGSPRFCTGLRPGEEAEFTYEVRARRGTHEFGPTALVARNVGGSAERRWETEVEGRLTCETHVEDVPLPADTSSYPGHVTTDAGGEGVEFYATREFQPSDPMNRVDWKRYAKTGELTTVEFRETRAATVTLVVDARTPAYVARREGEPDAVELSEYAAERLAAAFVRRNDRVGLARYGPSEQYLGPSGGDEQVARVRAALDDAPRPDSPVVGIFDEKRRKHANEKRFDTLRKRFPDSAQVVFLSPMADDFAVDVAKRFRAYGHAVTVLSPDPTGTDTAGGTVEGIERADRLAEVRSGGVRVVDWSPDEPVRSAVSAATARWSG